jgi:hypothetical protein
MVGHAEREHAMDMAMSRMADGQVLQLAAFRHGGGMTDEEARERCAGAPPHIKRSIDRYREARGMRRLWARDGKSAARWTPAEPGGVPIADQVMLVGVVAPGLSAVRVAATDGELLRERIEPTAYAACLRGVASKASVVTLQDGHGGDDVATTADGTLQMAVDDVAGLVVQAVIPVCGIHRQLLADAFAGECGLSLGLRPSRIELVRERGERIRVVRETAVDHVALIRGHQGKPAYQGKVFAALTADAEAMRMARAKAVVAALEGILEQRKR